MTKRYVGGGIKDDAGIFLPPSRKIEEFPPPLALNISEPHSLDEIGDVIIVALGRAVSTLAKKIVNEGNVSRDVIGALKDCESMHRDLSKKEKEFLASLSDEELAKLARESIKYESA